MEAPVKTRITELFEIEHPIIQGGMHYVGFAEMAAAVSNAGGLGIITGLTQGTPEKLAAEIKRCREMTDKPFGVNLTFLPAVTPPDYPGFVQAIIDSGVKAVETAGNNPAKWLPGLKEAGIKVIATGDVVDDLTLNDMGEAVVGMITSHHYSAAHVSAENEAYRAAFMKSFGVRPNLMAIGGYDGMRLIAEALRATDGKARGAALVDAMKGKAWMSPRGSISIDPATRDIVQNVYIRRVERVGEIKKGKSDHFLASPESFGWTLAMADLSNSMVVPSATLIATVRSLMEWTRP
jgi:hypothetical protein